MFAPRSRVASFFVFLLFDAYKGPGLYQNVVESLANWSESLEEGEERSCRSESRLPSCALFSPRVHATRSAQSTRAYSD